MSSFFLFHGPFLLSFDNFLLIISACTEKLANIKDEFFSCFRDKLSTRVV